MTTPPTSPWLEVNLTEQDMENYWPWHEKLLDVTDNCQSTEYNNRPSLPWPTLPGTPTLFTGPGAPFKLRPRLHVLDWSMLLVYLSPALSLVIPVMLMGLPRLISDLTCYLTYVWWLLDCGWNLLLSPPLLCSPCSDTVVLCPFWLGHCPCLHCDCPCVRVQCSDQVLLVIPHEEGLMFNIIFTYL